ncbi:MAG: SurA N-terminal domain-containing protein [Xanthomonadales bacterium]
MVLQSIRDRLNGIIALFILGLLVIPFAFVGVSSYFTSGANNAVAVVNDTEITLNEFNQAFQNYRRRMQAQMGAAFDPDAFSQPIVRRQLLDQMINEELLAQVAAEAGLAVSNDDLAAEIRSMAAFEVDGEFNVDVYMQRLQAQGLTPEQFERDMRLALVLDQFPTAIASSAIATPWEIRDYARLQDQTRAFSAIVVPAESDPEAAIAEEDIQAWYDAHPSDYMSEEQVVVNYLELNAADLGGAVDVSDEQLRARFEEQQARFITPEARLASHILIEVDPDAPQVDVEAARALAEELAERARAGEDFAELASEYSQDLGSAAQGGDLGWIEPGYMVQAFEDGLYALTPEHPISDPVQSRFGWHVIDLRDIRPAEGMTFTEARDTLLAEFEAEDAERRFIEQADRLIDIIYEDPTTLDAAANELGLPVLEAGPFSRSGAAEGIAANPEVVKAAFSDLVLGQRSVSDPVDLGENHMVLVLLKEHMPEAVRPLDEVRDQVVATLQRQRAMEQAEQEAESLLAQIRDGAAMTDLAAEAELEVVSEDAATRTMPGLDAALRSELFLMDEPGEDGPVRELVELADGYAVVELTGVTPGEIATEDEGRRQAYSRRISSASATDETWGFLQMLRAQSEIQVFEDRLQLN